MWDFIEFSDLKQMMPRFTSICDIARVVDPIRKKVMNLEGESLKEYDGFCCYDYWNRGEVCYNCVSSRAYIEKKILVKLEIKEDAVNLITAIPTQNGSLPLVVELIKDITDSVVTSCPEDENNVNGFSSKGSASRLIAELNDLAVKDHLTGLYNRRFIDTRLESDIVQAYLTGKPLSVMFIDADSFKTINSECGHVAGDDALKVMASVIKSSISEPDCWAARYGGDEFFVSMNRHGESDALKTAEAIQSYLENRGHVKIGEHYRKLSASLGVYTLSVGLDENNGLPANRITARDLISIADGCMYKAKAQGRNSIVSMTGKGTASNK